MLYLTSVLSKSSLSTAEKFGAGSAQFLGSRVSVDTALLAPEKIAGKRQTLLRTAAHDTDVISAGSP